MLQSQHDWLFQADSEQVREGPTKVSHYGGLGDPDVPDSADNNQDEEGSTAGKTSSRFLGDGDMIFKDFEGKHEASNDEDLDSEPDGGQAVAEDPGIHLLVDGFEVEGSASYMGHGGCDVNTSTFPCSSKRTCPT